MAEPKEPNATAAARAAPFTVSERFSAGFGPYMRAPDPELRKAQRQRRLDALQAARDAPKKKPARRPTTSWPFPTSPPTINQVSSTPVSVAKPKPLAKAFLAPQFDCVRCTREIYPVTRCECGTLKEQSALWKAADDKWFKEDRKGWFELNAPPQRSVLAVEKLERELAEEGEREAREAAERAATAESARKVRVLEPAEPGFRYLEQGGAIWLTPDDGAEAGSLIYMGDADGCVVSGPAGK
ncbi:hypothetical protein DFH06DRAFT_1334881 [Mycena polygramma]|nr:hypothetical protein DFH06DRAFT_1334881 [Mycena polygramma]